MIYLFIFGIMRLIYLDINSEKLRSRRTKGNYPYLKLLNQREHLNFKVEESYIVDKNLSIGRTSDNDIVLSNPFLSKKHARLIVREGQVYLEDLGSKNGTFLNENRLNKYDNALLRNGDKIRLGNVEFLFISKQSAVKNEV